MSYLADEDNNRACDGYPHAATVIRGYEWDSMLAELWQLIPKTPDFTAWLRVMPGTRLGPRSREYRLVYDDSLREPAGPGRPWTVTVHLFGIIKSLNLGRTGTWDGTEAGVVGAKQFVDIGPGKLPEPFRSQADTLYEVEQFIMATIRGGGLPVEVQDVIRKRRRQGIHLAKRVFTKVGPNTPAAIMSSGAAQHIIKKWRIVDSVRLAQRQEDDVMHNTVAATFAPGDFVHATIKFDIEAITQKGNEPLEVRIRHHLLSLVQLVSARNVPKVLQVSPSKTPYSQEEPAEVVVEEAIEKGFEFSMS